MTATLVKHHYAPRGTAKELFHIRAPELLVSGPAGTGKSRACLEKLNAMALLTPKLRALIVRKTASSLASTGLMTWENYVIPELQQAGAVSFYGGSPRESPQYRYQNGSTVTIGGMDKASKIMSSEYDIIFVQEATELTENDWEALTTRLRNGRTSFQQLLADANPSTPTHWLKVRADTGKTVMLHSKHEENPRYFDADGTITSAGADYLQRLDNLTGVRHARLRKGLWVAAEGLIYEDWDEATHLVDKFPIPDDWTRYWAVDFGFINPFVCQMWAEDPDGRLYLYREVYYTKRTVDQHAARILSTVTDSDGAWKERKPRAVITDHAAEERATLEKHLGLSTQPANKKVTEGIQAVQTRFREKRIFIMRNSLVEIDPELQNSKKPICTAEELPGYIWDTGTGKAPKEQPLKADDHGCDALRYVVAKVDLGAKKLRVGWM